MGQRPRVAGVARLAIAGLLLVTVAFAAALAVRVVQVSQDLEQAQAQLADADPRPDDLAAASTSAEAAAAHTAAAARRTQDPLWRIGELLPVVGDDLTAIRVVAGSVDDVTKRAVLPVLDVGAAVDPDQLRGPDGTIDLAGIGLASPTLTAADAVVTRAQAEVGAVDRSGLTARVDRAVGAAAAGLDDVATRTGPLARAGRLLPSMLGADGPRRYFLAFQNPAESRATGGIVGFFAVLEADAGRLRMVAVGANNDLPRLEQAPADLGPEYADLYGTLPSASENVNLSPQFPYAAEQLLALWRTTTGEQLDGVVSVDPVALSYLLERTGPVTLESGEEVDAGSVVELTLSEVYSRFDDQRARRDYLGAVIATVFDDLTSADVDPVGLLRGLGRGAEDRRVLLYSRHAEEQRDLHAAGLTGALPAADGSAVGVVVNNAGANKLDYYLDRAVTYDPGCPDGSRRSATLSLSLTNGAPSTGLPEYVRTHDVAGLDGSTTNRLNVSAYVPGSAGLAALTVDGERRPVASGRELGYLVLTAAVDVPAGETVRMEWQLDQPASPPVNAVFGQPLVRPMDTTVREACTGSAG